MRGRIVHVLLVPLINNFTKRRTARRSDETFNRNSRKTYLVVLALAPSIFSSSALASFFILFENSISNMGVAHAGGAALAEDATTV